MYFQQIQTREAYILFVRLRQEIDRPYYTLEVEPDGTIRQRQTGYGRAGSGVQPV